jgi:hypothetical protein
MGNTTTCSPKSPSPIKKPPPLFKLKPSSPLPPRIYCYKEQIHTQPILSHFKYKGNAYISIH